MFHWDTSPVSHCCVWQAAANTFKHSQKAYQWRQSFFFFSSPPTDEFRLLLTAANSSFVCRLTTCKVHSGYSANSRIIPHFNKMTASLSNTPARGTKESNGPWMASLGDFEGEIRCFSRLFVLRLGLAGLGKALTYRRDGLWSKPIAQEKQCCHFTNLA